MRPTRRRWATLVILSATWFAVACSGDEPVAEPATADTFIDDTEETVPFDPSDPNTLAGVSTSERLLEAGACFNHYQYYDQSDFLQQVTTVVGCNTPHDREAYFSVDYPAPEDATYPIDDELKQWAENVCLDEFEGFIGEEYVLSLLEIGTIIPTFENWTERGDRRVICYVFPDEGGRLLESVRSSGI